MEFFMKGGGGLFYISEHKIFHKLVILLQGIVKY